MARLVEVPWAIPLFTAAKNFPLGRSTGSSQDGVLLLGRVQGGMRLRELEEKTGLDYASTVGVLRQMKERSGWDKQLAPFLRQATVLLSNAKA